MPKAVVWGLIAFTIGIVAAVFFGAAATTYLGWPNWLVNLLIVLDIILVSIVPFTFREYTANIALQRHRLQPWAGMSADYSVGVAYLLIGTTVVIPLLAFLWLLLVIVIPFLSGMVQPSPSVLVTQAVPIAPMESATQAMCLATETMTAPFSEGVYAAESSNSYNGTVQVTVSGAGQASGGQSSDAFYFFTDENGNPIEPIHPDGWILRINGQLAHEWIPEGQVPPYRNDHVYTFPITAPGGTLSFGVSDTMTGDNTGSYTVVLCQP